MSKISRLLSKIFKSPFGRRKRFPSAQGPQGSYFSFIPYAVFFKPEDFYARVPALFSSFKKTLELLNKRDKIFCTVCDSLEEYSYDANSLRETLLCRGCGLNTRMRLMFTLFKQEISKKHGKKLAIYSMEAVTPFAQILKAYIEEDPKNQIILYSSEYLGQDYAPGEINEQGIMHQDVCHLGFQDDLFDIIISQDVMEHVYDYKKGFQEIYRVLRPKGICLMTIPFHCDRENIKEKAKIINGKVRYLETPEYHFSPQGKSLVFTEFGWNLVNILRDIGFKVSLEYYLAPEYGFVQELCSLIWRLEKPK